MKCYTVNGKGFDGLMLDDQPNPTALGEHDVLIDVQACSLNYRDLLIAKGQYGRSDFKPFIPVSDMGGIVNSVGAKVSEFKPGDRVFNSPFRFWPAGRLRSEWARTFIGGAGVDGVLAEQIIYPESALVKIPGNLTFAEAATFPIAGLTAWSAVITHGKAKPGEWVLLQGTGGVSIFAAQLAKLMGTKIILTTSHESKSKIVKEKLGVDFTLNYKDAEWPQQVKEITQGAGVDIVVDVSGGDTLAKSLKICNYGARVAVVGLLESIQSQINVMDLIHHQVQLKGIFMESTEELRAFSKAYDLNQLRPHIDRTFSFNEAKKAYEYLAEQNHIGKVIIDVKK